MSQLKQLLEKFDSLGIEAVTFMEFIWATSDNIDMQDSRKRTKINIAAKDNHLMVLKQLLEFGADPNVLDKDRFTALGLSVRENNDAIALELLNSGKVDLNIGAGNLGSPLHIAVVNHKLELVTKMVELGADVNKVDSEGNSPLHQLMSIYSKHETTSYKIMKILITNQADPNLLNSQKLSPLLLAIKVNVLHKFTT